MYWTKRHIISTPICMHRDRYEQLRDPEEKYPTDSKVRYMIDYLAGKYITNYIPEQNLALDEYLSFWKGRLTFKIYIPSKRETCGIKIYMVSESNTGYLI